MLNTVAWTPESGFQADLPPEKLKDLAAREDAVVWVDVESIGARELGQLRSAFHLPPAAVAECRELASLPKIDDFGSSIVVVLHRVQFERESRELQLREINFVLGRNWLITVRQDASTSVDSVRKRVASQPDLLQEGPARLMAEIMEVITSRYLPTVEYLEREIDTLEEKMFQQSGGTDTFSRILSLRHTVVSLRRSLVPQREVIHRLARGEFRVVAPQAAVRLRSVHDDLAWILTELEIHRELLTSAFEGHAAIASNRLAEISNRMNRVMERLTRFTTVFMPLTLLTGIYGMNFEWMPELKQKWGYPATLALLFLAGVGLSYYFKWTLPPVIEELKRPPAPGATRMIRRGSAPPKSTGIGMPGRG